MTSLDSRSNDVRPPLQPHTSISPTATGPATDGPGDRHGRSTHPTTIVIADEYEIVLRGLAELLASRHDLRICGEATTLERALELVEASKPGLVIMGLNLQAVDGVDPIERIAKLHPDARILVLSVHDESLFAERVIRAGARAFVSKTASLDQVLEAVDTVLAGDLYLTRAVRSRILTRISEGSAPLGASATEALTDRELQVFRLLGRGRSTREIADSLGLSMKTIDTHRAKIMRKLGLVDGVQLLQRAVEWMRGRGDGGGLCSHDATDGGPAAKE